MELNENTTAVETEEVTDEEPISNDSDSEGLTDVKLLDYYRQKYEDSQREIKELVAQRDKMKSRKPGPKPTESKEYQQLFEEKQTLQSQLDSLQQNIETEKKQTLFKQHAIKAGINPDYLESLDLIKVDYDIIDPDNPISVEIVVDSLKKKLPALFNITREGPKPPLKLVDEEPGNEEKIDQLLKEGKVMEAAKLMKLQRG